MPFTKSATRGDRWERGKDGGVKDTLVDLGYLEGATMRGRMKKWDPKGSNAEGDISWVPNT